MTISPARCAAQSQCGACSLLSLPYDEQLARKGRFIEELFSDICPAAEFHEVLGMDEPFHYRNKVTSPYVSGPSRKGAVKRSAKRAKRGGSPSREILCGMYAANSHRVIDTRECLIENETAKKVVQAIRRLMGRYAIEPYDEDAHSGFMRHAVVRVGHETGEVLVTLVTNGAQFPGSRNFCRELVKMVPSITTVVQNVNTRQTNVILGEEEKTLYGPGFILDTLCGLSFRISSRSFYQVNATQTEVLYRQALRMARFTGTETALDAYCGTGTIGLVAARGLPECPEAHARAVVGVDNVASAIRDARENARHNGVENATFEVGDAGAFMASRAQEGQALDVLLMDPPRAGSTEELLSAAVSMAPSRIVYISCNPRTQARDVSYLVGRGYQATEIQPVDMFPHTDHTECICALERCSS